MRKFSNATKAAVAQHPRAVARLVLAFVASLLVVLLALMGMSSGPNGALVFAQATESPSPTAPSTEPAIQFVNPVDTYDIGFPSDERPRISDRDDGFDQAYHVLAWTANLPDNAVVEAYYTPETIGGVPLPEVTIGALEQVEGQPNVWEIYWDIPDDVNDGNGTMTVRLFEGRVTGFEEIANDEVEVQMRHEDDDNPPSGDGQFAAETVELTWPTQNGEIGFHKPRGGAWRGIVNTTQSGSAVDHLIFYTKSAQGEEPEWIQCGDSSTSITCTLVGKDLPSQITAISALPYYWQDCCGLVQEEHASDAHVVRPYVQDPHNMTVKILPLSTTDAPGTTFRRVVAPDPQTGEPHQCLAMVAEVRDDRDRLVMGANVDIHATGPSDQLQFGDEDVISAQITSTESSSSAYKVPDKGGHVPEAGENCDRRQENQGEGHTEKPIEGEHGDHNRPGINDIKHRESTLGTGLSGGTGGGQGRYNFHLWSPNLGSTEVTAWVDDQPLASEAATREADTDTLDPSEPFATIEAQWIPSPMTVTFDPVSDTAAVGSCNRYIVRARSGTVPIRGVNVDVHATGPNNDLDFCDPGDGTERRSPELTGDDHPHKPEDAGEAHHQSADPAQPQPQHTEGESDDRGNFVIGITSTATGDTTLQGWIDGEKGADNDTLDAGEPNGTATKSWATSLADAELSFINPSPYGGGGANVSNKEDANRMFHIVTRVDAIDVPGVELFISSDGTNFTKIGDATRVGLTDTWEMLWDVNVADGSYTLRAQIPGTERRKDQAIVVNNAPTATNPNDVPFETLEITRPANAVTVPFADRKTRIEGVVSNGTEGVDLFYTRVGAKDTPQNADWILCGFAPVEADRSFSGDCQLAGGDQPTQVTGLAAITYDCVESDCDPAPPQPVQPGTPPPPREPGARDSGDAHRVFGFEAQPLMAIEPAEAAGPPGSCQRFVLNLVDRAGQGIPDENIDIHLTGPTNDAHFCAPESGATPNRAPDQGGHGTEAGHETEGFHSDTSPITRHTEGETTASGRFVFGVTSPATGDSQILAWVDQNDDDVQGADESQDTALMHWVSDSGNGGNNCTLEGDSQDNVLRGTAGRDIICGRGGNDTIIGRGGNDLLKGGGGKDIIRGGGGRDVLRGGAGADRLRAGSANDRLLGNAGNDFLNGQTGRRDVCRGGRGRDRARNCER